MRWLLIALGGSLVACTNDFVEVVFEPPAAHADLIATQRLSVLREDGFGCDDIAMRRVDEVAYGNASIAQFTLTDEESVPLSGLPRHGPILFVVEAFDDAGALVAGGCAASEGLDGGVLIEIAGEPASSLALSTAAPWDPWDGAARVEDPRGNAADHIETRWLVAPTDPPRSGSVFSEAGALSIDVRGPGQAGPGLVEVASRWQRDAPITTSFFCSSPAIFDNGEGLVPMPVPEMGGTDIDDLHPVARDYFIGRIGPDGQLGVAVLGHAHDLGAGVLARRLAIVYRDGANTVSAGVDVAGTLDDMPRVLAGRAEGDRDTVVIASVTAFSEVSWVGASLAVTAQGAGAPVVRVVPAGPCSDGGLFIAQLEDGFALFDANDGYAPSVASAVLPDPTPDALLTSGCVAIDGETLRVIGYAADALVLRDERGRELRQAIAGSNALTFSSDRALWSVLDGEGFALGIHQLVGDGGALAIDARERIATALPMVGPAAGDIDGDDLLDAFAIVVTELEADGSANFVGIGALGATHRGERIRAFGPSSGLALREPFTALADLDGDGLDDLLLGSLDGFAALRMGPQDQCP